MQKFISGIIALVISVAFGFEIDVIIPAIRKDACTLPFALEGVGHLRDVRRVVLISNEQLVDGVDWINECDFPFTKEAIEELLPKRKNRAGWYFQQLLKLYVQQVDPSLSEHILIIDGDVVFLRPIQYVDEEGRVYIPHGPYPPQDYTDIYINHAKRLLPYLTLPKVTYNHIAHHAIFSRKNIRFLIDEVERIHNKPFWKVFIEMVDPEFIFAGASEYELYSLFCLHHNLGVERKLMWADVPHLFTKKKFSKKAIDFIACHSYRRLDHYFKWHRERGLDRK